MRPPVREVRQVPPQGVALGGRWDSERSRSVTAGAGAFRAPGKRPSAENDAERPGPEGDHGGVGAGTLSGLLPRPCVQSTGLPLPVRCADRPALAARRPGRADHPPHLERRLGEGALPRLRAPGPVAAARTVLPVRDGTAHPGPAGGGARRRTRVRGRSPSGRPLAHPAAAHGPGPRPAFRAVAIHSAGDALATAARYLRWLGYREVVQLSKPSPALIDLVATGLLAQVDTAAGRPPCAPSNASGWTRSAHRSPGSSSRSRGTRRTPRRAPRGWACRSS